MLEQDTVYYELDSRRLTFGECWRLSAVVGFPILALAKIVRFPIATRSAAAFPDRLAVGDPCEVDQGGRGARLARLYGHLSVAGFRFRFLHKPLSIDPDGSSMQLVYLSEDGRTLATLTDAVVHKQGLTLRETTVALVSALAGGRYLVTSNRIKDLDVPANFLVERRRTRNGAKVLARHRERLEGLEGASVERIEEDDLEALLLTLEQQVFQYLVGRRVLRPVKPRKLARLRRAKPQRGGTLVGKLARGWLLWPVAFAAAGLFLPFAGGGPADLDELLGAETPHELSCPVAPPPVPGEAVVAPHAGRSSLVGLFASEAEATRALSAPALAGDDRVARQVSTLVVVRTVDGSTRALQPIARELAALGAEPMLDSAEGRWSVGFHLRWRANAAEARAASEALTHYLAAPSTFHLTPPWGASAPVDERQAAARRAFYELERTEGLAPWSGLKLTLKSLWMAFGPGGGEIDGFSGYEAEIERQLEERVETLLAESDAVDAETANLYLAWKRPQFFGARRSDSPWAEDEEPTAAELLAPVLTLGRHLGQLELERGPEGVVAAVDADHLFAAQGWVPETGDGAEVGVSYLSFNDAAVGLPALAAYLCAAGAESIALGVTGEALELDGVGSGSG